MKRLQSILFASLLTVAMVSTTFAGNITTRHGNITTATASGNITTATASGNITTATAFGNITTLFMDAFVAVLGNIHG